MSPFKSLRFLHIMDHLHHLLHEEPPQFIAVIALHLPEEKTVQLLSHFKDERLQAILDAMEQTQTQQWNSHFLAFLDKAICKELESGITKSPMIDPVSFTDSIRILLPQNTEQ